LDGQFFLVVSVILSGGILSVPFKRNWLENRTGLPCETSKSGTLDRKKTALQNFVHPYKTVSQTNKRTPSAGLRRREVSDAKKKVKTMNRSSTPFHRRPTGFTLVELSVVFVLVVLIASALVTMLKQQVQFSTWWNTQKFIVEDAPLANNMVVRVFGKADAFKIYSDKTAALAGGAGTTANGTAMLVGYSQGDGSKKFGLVEFDGATNELKYNVLNDAGSGVVSSWTIAGGVSAASFDVVNSTMQLTLTGPYGGQVTYAATPSL